MSNFKNPYFLFSLFAQYGELRGHLFRAGHELLTAFKIILKPVIEELNNNRGDLNSQHSLEVLHSINHFLDFLLDRTAQAKGEDALSAYRREAMESVLNSLDAEIALTGKTRASKKKELRLEILIALKESLSRRFQNQDEEQSEGARKIPIS